MDFTGLDVLRNKLESLRPFPPAMLQNLHEDLVLRWTYNSNAIEGNTLTLKETKVVLEGITIGGKSLREHFEALNHRDAIAYVEELVQGKDVLSQWQIRNLHRLVLKNIDDENAGCYRSVNVTISGARHVPPSFLHLAAEMAAFMTWCEGASQALHPLERAARLHADFVKIHPFVDGNGRTARLLMNLELMKAGFPPLVLPVEQRLAYYEALDLAHTAGEYGPFLELMKDCAERAFVPYWHALGLVR